MCPFLLQLKHTFLPFVCCSALTVSSYQCTLQLDGALLVDGVELTEVSTEDTDHATEETATPATSIGMVTATPPARPEDLAKWKRIKRSVLAVTSLALATPASDFVDFQAEINTSFAKRWNSLHASRTLLSQAISNSLRSEVNQSQLIRYPPHQPLHPYWQILFPVDHRYRMILWTFSSLKNACTRDTRSTSLS